MTSDSFPMRPGVFHLTTIGLAAVGFCGVLLSRAPAEDIRTWSDISGKYQIKGRFVRVSEGKVTLEREDGTELTIRLEQLTEADRKVVAEIQANDQNPFKVVKPGRKSARTKADKEPGEEQEKPGANDGAAKVVAPGWSDAKQVLLASARGTWTLPIDAPEPSANYRGQAIALPGKLDFFEHERALAINPICRRAVIGYVWDRPGEKNGVQTRLVLCDLEKGKLLAIGKMRDPMVPLALNDAGTDVLMRPDEFGFANQDHLEIWNLTEAGISKRLQWTPHDDEHGGKRDIKWARYVGAEKLLTLSTGGKLTLWNVATMKALYWLQIDSHTWPALSPHRKYLAFTAERQIGVLDLGTGEAVALQSAPSERFASPVFAFSPQGTRLACDCRERIYVWDWATGALFRDISLVGMQVFRGENLICPSEEHVLVGHSLLIDIDTQAKIWTYEGHELVGMLGRVCWFAVTGEKSGALLPAVLPQPSAKAKIQKALDSADFFVLKPGVTVKLDVGALQDPGEREKATAAFTQQLQANGCQVGTNGTVELVAATEPGKRRDVAYRTFGRPVAREYTVQEYISRVKIVWQGQTAWEVSCSSVPGFIRLGEGETMQQFLQRKEHPDYDWFGKVELPKVVQKPTPGSTTLGTTQVTVSGLP
jgi:hypothetical protein